MCIDDEKEKKRAICHSHLYKMPYYLFDLEILPAPHRTVSQRKCSYLYSAVLYRIAHRKNDRIGAKTKNKWKWKREKKQQLLPDRL